MDLFLLKKDRKSANLIIMCALSRYVHGSLAMNFVLRTLEVLPDIVNNRGESLKALVVDRQSSC